MIYFHKILPYLLYPITFIVVFLIWGAITRRRLPILIALFLLVITSSPIISTPMVRHLEGGQLRKSSDDIRAADAVVVLSGMIQPVQGLHDLFYEWGDPDRFFGGIELMKARKANYIIFTGGKLPWQSKDIKPEGYILTQFALDFGIPKTQIILTKEVQNTKDEAIAVKEILQKNNANRIILVTSAFHMPRAIKLFEREGIEVQSYPVDFKIGLFELTPMNFLPSAGAFYNFEFSWRELIGKFYYNIKN